jgi:hypothetical protein
MSILALMASFVLSGCATHLGYVPNDVYAGCFWPRTCTAPNSPPPSYLEVKNWAVQVEDGYDTRAVFNRQALYGGALIAAASTGALVGLAAFNTGGAVITALPIGATFLGGAMAIYNNEQKAVIYGSASQTIRNVLIQNDLNPPGGDGTVDPKAAICLHAEVSEVIRRVNNHITLLDPKNVADLLKGVAASVQKKQTAAVNKQADAQAAQKTNTDTPTPANKDLADKATSEANTANAAAKQAQDENTVQSVAAAANDFSDLQELPDLKEYTTELQTYCAGK